MNETMPDNPVLTIFMVDCHIRLGTWADYVAEKMEMKGKRDAVGECR